MWRKGILGKGNSAQCWGESDFGCSGNSKEIIVPVEWSEWVGEKREMRPGGEGTDHIGLMNNWKEFYLFSGGNGEPLEGFKRGGPWNESHFTGSLAPVLTMDSGEGRRRGEQLRISDALAGAQGKWWRLGAGWKQWRWWEVDSGFYFKGRTSRLPDRLGTKRDIKNDYKVFGRSNWNLKDWKSRTTWCKTSSSRWHIGRLRWL